ncbi:MAG: sugar transferase [Acidobacteriota bacterium]|nr:sugar transferase [Acidobacteriota bacterium]
MKGNLPKYLLLFADLAAILVAFRVAYFLRYEVGLAFPNSDLPTPAFGSYGAAILLSVGTWILIFLLYGVDHFPGMGESALAISKLLTASIFLIATLMAGMYLAKVFYSRLLFLFLSLLVVLFLFATRLILRSALLRLRKHGLGLRRVVIVGQSELAAELAERIERHLDLHYQIVGFLAPAAGRMQTNGDLKASETIMNGSEAMASELAAMNIHELLFAIPVRRETETLEFIAHCQQRGITIKTVPEYYDLHTSHIESLNLDGIPILEMKGTAIHPAFQMVKRVIDLGLAVVTLPITIPIMGVISSVLYLGSGKVIKGETRVGMGGRPFTLYRFNLAPRLRFDSQPPRSEGSQLARSLVRYSISELPQIWNVLRGDMSFVGPRPESPERVRHYSAWHRRRLQLKPGITGLAQVNGLRDKDSSDLKTKFDLEYAANYTPLVDLALVLATVNTLASRRKAGQPGPSAPSSPPGLFGGSMPADTLDLSGS